ncbi:M15 family metallopeptidase [Rickettsiales endosymbiont of Stachyamoeba lipophora]|uniref:M15 family metallopeptidase n=1 Tax=Rickettsiales endosymbiont of Stachyamoeba lipophora TaxID=2486578 RepID=UPI000F647E1B|nr:M15 family metallopeptidase [Rickettsiales endosymbiont of Stachyamoeba lipophora]AZL16300.1 M15 family peptidase [Rickettsiales endosymbiont of Stachyamoeba lipophora]
MRVALFIQTNIIFILIMSNLVLANPISVDRIIAVSFKHYDFEGKEQAGEIEVLDVTKDNVVQIFKELHKHKFPIHKARPMKYYQGDDELSMSDNNSSSFNPRFVTGNSSIPSIHAYGLAIDINPIQNPYIVTDKAKDGLTQVLPYQGTAFLNRHNPRAGMVEDIVEIFAKNGFSIWGGRWNEPIDYHHFQTSRVVAIILSKLSYDLGKKFFALYTAHPILFNKINYQDDKWFKLIEKNPQQVIDVLRHNIIELEKIEPDNAYDLLLSKII